MYLLGFISCLFVITIVVITLMAVDVVKEWFRR